MGLFEKVEKSSIRPHVVCVPFPGQGHINPFLKVAKLLHHHKGFHITFVNTEFNHQVILQNQGPHALDGLSTFRFETIPDGLPPSNARMTEDLPLLFHSTSKNCLAPFRELLAKLESSDVPPVTCIISDFIMSFTLEAAEEVGIPNLLFWTSSACSFMGYLHYSQLIQKGFTPLKDWSYLTNGYMDTVIDWIPGMEGIRLKDLPTLIRTTDPNDPMLKFALGELDRYFKFSPKIIINTFDSLEHEIFEALPTVLPTKIYSIGPIHCQLNNIDDQSDDDTNSIGILNLWKDETECLAWLDCKEPNSVLYVNFGTTTIMSPDQLVEFSWGLVNSNQAFLWIIRPDLVVGETAIIPLDLVEAIKKRGLLASWCSQEQVVGHPSVGGFLTHNGWNSTLESISSGVPMLCWPFFSDQQTNCWYCCSRWGIGMEIDNDVKRDQVEVLVKELMVGEKGKKMKEKALEWKRLAQQAVDPNHGSSYLNLEEVVNNVLLSNVTN